RRQLGQIDVLGDVIRGAFVGDQVGVLVAAPHGREIVAHRVIGGKDRGGGAQLCAHVGNDVPVHRRQVRQAGTVILDDPVDPTLDVVAAQHLQDHVLGR